MSAKIKQLNIKGLKIPVIFEKQEALPIVNIQLVFTNSGSIQDNKKAGLAKLSSKLLNEGTKSLGSVGYASVLEENAISIHSDVGFETFVLEMSSLKDKSKQGFKLLKQLLDDPNYSKETLEKLKVLQTGSLNRKENDYDYVSKVALKSVLFKDTPLEKPSSGTIKSITKIELKDIKEFLNNTLDLNNLIVVAGGDITFEKLEKRLNKLLENLSAQNKNQLTNVQVSAKETSKNTLTKDTQQAYIYFGSPFNMSASDDNYYKAKVASFILGGSGFGSRLMEEIRVKRGLAYSAYGNILVNKSHSYFSGYLQTKNENSEEAVKLVEDIVEEFIKNGVTKDELQAAKNFLSGSEPLRTETLSQRLNRAFMLYYRGLEQNYPQMELDKISSLDLDDLNNFIKSHDEIKNITFSIVRN
ncbi:MAG: pitrilysin family protein [Sulfurovum sp.]|jgi:predicted Zn-dependent peptidase